MKTSSSGRTPIITRVPIVTRTPIYKKMIWEEQLAKYDNLIKFAANQIGQQLKVASLTAEDLYQEGLLLLWTCFNKYKSKPEKEFQFIFKSSMWRRLRFLGNKHNAHTTDDIDSVIESELEPCSVSEVDCMMDSIEDEYKVKQIRLLLAKTPIALLIFNELIEPSEKTVEEWKKDVNRKEMLQSMGKKVQIPQSIEIGRQHIQRAYNIIESIYKENFKLVQGVVYSIYSENAQIKNYRPDPDWFNKVVKNMILVQDAAISPEMLPAMVEDTMEEPVKKSSRKSA